MPPVIAAIVTALTWIGISAATAAILAPMILSFGASLLLGAISKLFSKGPSASSLTNQLNNRTVTTRQAVAPWRVMYGSNRVGGIITFLHTTGTKNEKLHIVITLAGHEVNAIPTMYFDGVAIPLDGSGNATGNFAGFVHAEFNLGTRQQAAFPGLLAAAAAYWDATHRQRNRAGAYVQLTWDQNKFPNGVPNITFDVQGRLVYDPGGAGVQTPAFAQNIEVDQPAGSQATWAYVLGSNVQAGSLLVFACRELNVTGVTDSKGNTWVKLYNTFWYALNCAAGATTVTVAFGSATHMQGDVAEYTGVANLAPDVSADIASGTSTTATSTSVTPIVNGDLILGWGFNGTTNSPTYTAGTGYTLRDTGTKNAFLEDKVQLTAAAITAVVTINASDAWSIGIVAFKAAANTGGRLAYSSNAALCIADYLNNASFGLVAQTKYPITAAMLANAGFSAFNAANLVDGDVTTNGWANNPTNANSTVTVDLGAGNGQEFCRCRFYLSTAGQVQTYHIQWSDDSITWASAEEHSATGMLPDVNGWNEVELAPSGAHRYWRILAIATITEAGFVNELEFYTSDVDSTLLIAAANTCDEQVALLAGGNQNRFAIDGSFDTSESPANVIGRMNSAMAGSVLYVAGKWGIYPGIWRAPTISLSDADFRGPMTVQTRLTHRDLYNGVKGMFISPTKGGQ